MSNYKEYDPHQHIKDKLKITLIATPLLILFMWLSENNYFGAFG